MSEPQNVDSLLQQNYFVLLRLPTTFAQDSELLDKNYRALVAKVHPDRYVNASEAEKNHAMILATQVNSAYQTLKNPLQRGRYLLTLMGVDTEESTNTFMPKDFLLAQIEWREAIAESLASKDIEALESLSTELSADIRALEDDLLEALDTKQDQAAAVLAIRKWCFLNKLDEQIGESIEALLG